MTDIFWGDPIAVDGVRPEWLGADDRVCIKDCGDLDFYGDKPHSSHWFGHEINNDTRLIKLPASHFAYKALAAGFVPWGGGDEAPVDWDGGEILMIDGHKLHEKNLSWRWSHQHDGVSDIIGYRRRTEQPANADTMTVQRNTAEAWQELFDQQGAIPALRALGLISEPTQAERIASDTGIDLATVERVLAARA